MHTHRRWLLLLVVALNMCGVIATVARAETRLSGTPTTKSYLPLVTNSSTVSCAFNEQEQQLSELLINDPNQQHASLTCHPILAQVARARAQDMVDRHYFSHTNPDGYGPNYLVVQAGYVLPAFYSTAPDGNNIESVAAGYPSAQETWDNWMTSPGHREHLLGETPFYAEQSEYGIGYARGGDFGHYWVVIIAKPGP